MYFAELWFTATPPYRLFKTVFLDTSKDVRIIAVRGKTGSAYGITNTFQWTAAVQGVCSLLLDYVLSPCGAVTVSGTRNSLVRSLDQAIVKRCNWCVDMFGIDAKGTLTISKFFQRSSPDRALQSGETAIRVNDKRLPQANISFFIGDKRLQDSSELKALRRQLALRRDEACVSREDKKTVSRTANDDLLLTPAQVSSNSRYHKRAIILDRPLLIPHRLAQISHTTTDEESSFEVSRLFVLAGDPDQSRSIIQTLLGKAQTRADALYLAGHLSNLNFIALDEEVFSGQGELDDFRSEHRELLLTLELPNVTAMHSQSLEQQVNLFRTHDALSLLHLHIFSCSLEAEMKAGTPSLRKSALWQHYATIQLLKGFCPAIAWDRYSPFIAQALRLGETSLAYKAWREARRYASAPSVSRNAFDAPVYAYAKLQRKSWSIEWKIHEYLGVCLDLLKGNPITASRRLRMIKSHLAIFPEPYLTIATEELQKVVDRSCSSKSARLTWPSKLPVASHASYLTAWAMK